MRTDRPISITSPAQDEDGTKNPGQSNSLVTCQQSRQVNGDHTYLLHRAKGAWGGILCQVGDPWLIDLDSPPFHDDEQGRIWAGDTVLILQILACRRGMAGSSGESAVVGGGKPVVTTS